MTRRTSRRRQRERAPMGKRSNPTAPRPPHLRTRPPRRRRRRRRLKRGGSETRGGGETRGGHRSRLYSRRQARHGPPQARAKGKKDSRAAPCVPVACRASRPPQGPVWAGEGPVLRLRSRRAREELQHPEQRPGGDRKAVRAVVREGHTCAGASLPAGLPRGVQAARAKPAQELTPL
jgi:hypothetical protein